MNLRYHFFAAYGDDTYGRSTYGDSASGGLANTGLWILLAVTAACLLIFFALLVRFWRRKRKVTAISDHETILVSPSE